MVILVTGFNPFGRLAVNPSQLIVQALESRSTAWGGVELKTQVLPTEFVAAGHVLAGLIRAGQPQAVLCLGVAGPERCVRLERVALNLDDSDRPDNRGDAPRGQAIDPEGPLAYLSTLPLERMLGALSAKGIPAEISNHAGTFVCNHAFYVSRRTIEGMGTSIPCGFIHVPLLPGQALALEGEQGGMPLEAMLAAVECCLEVIVQDTLRPVT